MNHLIRSPKSLRSQGNDMNSELIAVIVEQYNKIRDLNIEIASLNESNLAQKQVSEPKAQTNMPEPNEDDYDAWLSKTRVLKTAMEIIRQEKSQSGVSEANKKLCELVILRIQEFAEEVLVWNNLYELEPYLWGDLGEGEEHFVNREFQK